LIGRREKWERRQKRGRYDLAFLAVDRPQPFDGAIVTIHLSLDYVSAAKLHDVITADMEVYKHTRSLLFCRYCLPLGVVRILFLSHSNMISQSPHIVHF
jgi:hypothetical protein